MAKIYTHKDIVDLEFILAEKWTWGNKARTLSAANGWSTQAVNDDIQLKIANAIIYAMDKLITELGIEEEEYLAKARPYKLPGIVPKKWKPNNKYITGDLIEYNNTQYVATTNFTSGERFKTDYLLGISYKDPDYVPYMARSLGKAEVKNE